MMGVVRRALWAALAIAFFVAGCGGDDEGGGRSAGKVDTPPDAPELKRVWDGLKKQAKEHNVGAVMGTCSYVFRGKPYASAEAVPINPPAPDSKPSFKAKDGKTYEYDKLMARGRIKLAYIPGHDVPPDAAAYLVRCDPSLPVEFRLWRGGTFTIFGLLPGVRYKLRDLGVRMSTGKLLSRPGISNEILIAAPEAGHVLTVGEKLTVVDRAPAEKGIYVALGVGMFFPLEPVRREGDTVLLSAPLTLLLTPRYRNAPFPPPIRRFHLLLDQAGVDLAAVYVGQAGKDARTIAGLKKASIAWRKLPLVHEDGQPVTACVADADQQPGAYAIETTDGKAYAFFLPPPEAQKELWEQQKPL